jgi:undecaprenyl diphosphate synthase
MQSHDSSLPQHVAIIMDGNGRWATQQHLSRLQGHAEGAKRVYEISEAIQASGISNLSLFAFSTENWKRSSSEVKGLFTLLNQFAKTYLKPLIANKVRLLISGDMSLLPDSTQALLNEAIESTASFKDNTLNICLNYGGQDDIVQATKRIIKDVTDGKITTHQLTPDVFSSYLYTQDMPPVDLLIRTSGEQRLSNFLLYQLAYAELYFTETYWPDFKKEDLQLALDAYTKRRRRFGGI